MKSMKMWKKLGVLFLVIIFCMSFGMQTLAAASANYKAAVVSYQKFVKKNKGSYDIVDIDKNGIPELIIHNMTAFKNQVYTCDTKTKKMKRLINKDLGRCFTNQITYSVKKHQIMVPFADSQNYVSTIYKVSGKTVKKVATYKNHAAVNGTWYAINNKRVSRTVYKNKLASAIKGFK